MTGRTGKCPQCGLPVRLSRDNPWRPFCSERCRLIDLGEWLEGGRSIPTDEPAGYHGSDDEGEPTQH